MTVHREDLESAVAEGLLTRAQAEALWERAVASPPAPPFDLARTAFAAALVTATAIALAMLLLSGWEQVGPAAGLVLALVEGAVLTTTAWVLAIRPGTRAYAPFVAAAAVPLGPAAVFAAQTWAGVDPGPPLDGFAAWVTSPASLAAAAGVAAAVAALWAVPAPLLSGVLVVAVWAGTMTTAPSVVFGPAPTWGQHTLLSVLVGVVAMAAGAWVDGRVRRDHAEAFYCTGLAAFCGGVATLHAGPALSLAGALAAYAALTVVGLALRRRCFAAFGGLGITAMLAHLADELLADPVVPFAFAAVTAALVGAALLYDRVAPAGERAVMAALPLAVRRLLPPHGR